MMVQHYSGLGWGVWFFVFLVSSSLTTISAGQKPEEHMVEKRSFGTEILKDKVSLA